MQQSRVDPALFAGFAQPNPEFSPVPIWWWSGEPLDLERMRWQIDQLVSQGVHNAVVLNLAPTGPVHGALSDAPHMGTDSWWEVWDGLCAHAQKVGMRLWFYDQFGFSGANLQGRLAVANPSFVGLALDRVAVEVDGAGQLVCPEAGLPVAGAAIPLGADGSPSGPPVALEINEGKVSWSGRGRARLMIAYALRKGFDYHSPEACAALIDIVHGEFERRLGKYFGTSLVGSFQDELPSVPSWSERFEREFETRCGYAIAPRIAALWEDRGLESAQLRADYQRVRAALAEAALFKPLFEWHERRGLTFGVDQQSPARAGEPLGATDQYADYARTHRWYSAPGSDHWGNAKFHSSLAHSYGRPRTWIESFHSSGWGGTLEETFDWLQPWLLAGANLYNPHAVYYSTKGGQWEWAAPSTCWRQPYWRHYKHFADTISRLCWLATRGEHVCDIGLCFPSAAVQADIFLDHAGPKARAAHGAYMQLMGSMIWFNTQKGVLERMRRDFDVLDDDTLAAAAVEQGSLATRAERYRSLIVPNAWMIEAATLKTLVAFASAGGLLIVIDALPDAVASGDGAHDLETLRDLAHQGRVKIVPSGDGLRERLEAVLQPIEHMVVADSPTLLRRAGKVNILFVTAATEGSATAQPMLPWAIWDYDSDIFPMARYNSELREKGYDFDPGRNPPSAIVRLNGPVGVIEQWDPASGTSRPVQLRRGAYASEVVVDFSLSPMSVLVWRQDGEADEAPAERVNGPVLTLAETWRSRLVPTIDNRHGDFTLPAHEGALPVQAWSLGHREDTVTTPSPNWTDRDWNDVAVSFGLRAWQLGPTPASDLPAPLPPGHAGRLDDSGWEPVSYSLSRGVEHDIQHDRTLGPKGRVPEDFWRVRKVKAGEAVQFRTMLPTPAGPLTLAVGGNGAKTIWWNGARLAADRGGYLYLSDVASNGGSNLLEVRVEAVADDDLAGYWALTTDRDAFERPEWLQPADIPQPGTTIIVSRAVEVGAGESFEAQFASQGIATLLVNGTEVAMHGAFDPYAGWQMVRIIKYDLTQFLRSGRNTVAVRFTDIGKPISMLFDGVVTAPRTNQPRSIVSDMQWTAERDGRPIDLVLQPSQRNDPRYALLRARPHPLPRTGWLDPEQPLAGVLDIVPEARPAEPKLYQWFALAVPPGATAMTLPADGVDLAVFAAGVELPVTAGRCELSQPAPSLVLIRARAVDGRYGGAIWDGPIGFEIDQGEITLGPWSERGLAFYSGGVAYEQEVLVDSPGRFSVLDLGTVRGTAEVSINGTSAGARVWSLYRFDISGLLRPGPNTITVQVFNTLAPYLKGASPSRTIFKGQDVSGMMGPVVLR